MILVNVPESSEREEVFPAVDAGAPQRILLGMGSSSSLPREVDLTDLREANPCEIVKQVLSLSGVSQQELARRLALPPQTISSWARGEREISLPSLLKLCDAAGLKLTVELPPR